MRSFPHFADEACLLGIPVHMFYCATHTHTCTNGRQLMVSEAGEDKYVIREGVGNKPPQWMRCALVLRKNVFEVSRTMRKIKIWEIGIFSFCDINRFQAETFFDRLHSKSYMRHKVSCELDIWCKLCKINLIWTILVSQNIFSEISFESWCTMFWIL